MTVESVTQAVSNLALQFGEEDADPGAMVSVVIVPSCLAVLWDLGCLSSEHVFPWSSCPLTSLLFTLVSSDLWF